MIVFVCWFVRQIYEKNSSKLVYSLFFHTFADILGKFMKNRMQTTVKLISVLLLLMVPNNIAADNLPYLAEGVIDTTCHETLGLQRVEAVKTVNIFTATDLTDHYANGVVMTAFKGKLYCMWQSSPKDEDSDDTWVAYSTSADEGMTWSAPQPLALSTDEFYCTSGGWLVRGDTLTAFIDTWQKGLAPRGGHTCYMTTTEGQVWSELQLVRMADGQPMAGVLEQDPYTLPDGRLVGASHLMPGLHICPVYTDDPTGHHGWQRADFESEDAGKQSRELEPSLCCFATRRTLSVNWHP